jgi:hypothetical protein
MAATRSYTFRLLLFSGALMAFCNLILFSKVHELNTDSSHRNSNALYFFLNSSALSCRVLRTVEDIRRCYPNHLMRQLPKNCHKIETWSEIQRCVTGRFHPVTAQTPPPLSASAQNQTIYTVHIIGERNSGTKWVQQELQQCFPRNTVFNFKVHRDFIRSKHFFQPIRPDDYSQSILLSVFRNPVDWVAAMREAPYHSPRHVAGFQTSSNGSSRVIPLPWKDFVETVWATKRTAFDLQLIHEDRVEETTSGDVCREGFPLYEVVPCRYNMSTDNALLQIPEARFRGYEPIYELRRDHTGRPFANILELRRDKIVNFALELPLLMKLGGYSAVRYEDLLQQGTRFLLEEIASMFGMDELPASCRPTDPQPERIGKRQVPPDFRAYVQEHMDQATERLLGYQS